ncbi:hypothetical protein FE374_13205 [Georgenia yuyongxinii]|uniref:Uncharacterized protein n=1 Tax=Georgenia yuyongxinii TaxID=2589797 RepID=A0A5B8C5U0_9MICO|nr:hypothetical protein [Georgenia yuyongxinii]QDC25440.1 hypothetical protein FE374_13205 [Georgenia yuyongxinii]
MSRAYDFSSHLPVLADFSAEDRRLAEEALRERVAARRNANDARARAAEELTRAVDARLVGLLGGEGLTQLRRALRREQLDLRGLREPPQGLWLDHQEANAARKARVAALLRGLGADLPDLRRIATETTPTWRRIVESIPDRSTPGLSVARNLDAWLELSPLHKQPLPWGGGGPDTIFGWQIYRPPFADFVTSFEPLASSGFRVERLHTVHPYAGLVGNDTRMDCDDASNWDYAHAMVETQVAFAFVPPVTGQVEVLIDAQCAVGTHDLRTENEFGFSTHWTYQKNYLMADVLHPDVAGPSLALMSQTYSETEEDETIHRENVWPGQHYYARLFSTGRVPGGQSVIVTVGTRTFDITRADDMEVHSRTNFRWFISSVEVRISPEGGVLDPSPA